MRDEVAYDRPIDGNPFFPDSYIIAEIETDNKNLRYAYGAQ